MTKPGVRPRAGVRFWPAEFTLSQRFPRRWHAAYLVCEWSRLVVAGAPQIATQPLAFGDLGVEIALEPGAQQDFDVEVVLASCDPTVGYVVPPGDHFVAVSFYNARLQTTMSSEPLPVTIE